MGVHDLKISPTYFKDIISEEKTFEIRKNDRNYQIGDILILKEYEEGIYSGREIRKQVSYILKDIDFPDGIKEGYCVMSLI